MGVGLRDVAVELREVEVGIWEVEEREPAPTREVAGGEDGAADGECLEVWRRTLRTSKLFSIRIGQSKFELGEMKGILYGFDTRIPTEVGGSVWREEKEGERELTCSS